MKKFLAFLLSLIMVFSLVACTLKTPEVTEPDTSISTEIESETTDADVPDINAGAIAILEEMLNQRLGDSDFIDVVLAYVPDVFMLKEYRCACWTYFLVMEDGLEYIVITDYDGKITSICEWYPDEATNGLELYSNYPVE